MADLTVAAALAVLAIGLGCDHSGGPRMTPQAKSPTATLELTPTGSDWSVAFTFRNPSAQAVDATMHEPFLGFTLAVATADGKRLELVQPAIDTPSRAVPFHLDAGGAKRLATPFRLRFDPKVTPAGGDDPFVWSIVSAPVPVVVSAHISIEGLPPMDAQARLPGG